MSKKWQIVLLSMVFLLLIAVALGIWQWQKLGTYPYLVDTVRYGLGQNWYLGEFQPIFLRQYTSDNTQYFDVLYQNPQGKWTKGQILVGYQYSDETLPMLPVGAEVGAKLTEPEKPTYHYPFWPGQRIKLLYLTARKGAQKEGLQSFCAKSTRLCQLADLLLAKGNYQDTVASGGLEPSMPVLAVSATKDISQNEPITGGE